MKDSGKFSNTDPEFRTISYACWEIFKKFSLVGAKWHWIWGVSLRSAQPLFAIHAEINKFVGEKKATRLFIENWTETTFDTFCSLQKSAIQCLSRDFNTLLCPPRDKNGKKVFTMGLRRVATGLMTRNIQSKWLEISLIFKLVKIRIMDSVPIFE